MISYDKVISEDNVISEYNWVNEYTEDSEVNGFNVVIEYNVISKYSEDITEKLKQSLQTTSFNPNNSVWLTTQHLKSVV